MKFMFKTAPPVAEILAKLKLVKVTLSEEKIAFLKQHEGHQGLSIDVDRIYCRTCNRRDLQR